jgi:hypothetical protein
MMLSEVIVHVILLSPPYFFGFKAQLFSDVKH